MSNPIEDLAILTEQAVVEEPVRQFAAKTGFEVHSDRQLQDLCKWFSLYPNAPNNHWYKNSKDRIVAELRNRGYTDNEIEDWTLEKPTLKKHLPDSTYN